MADADWVYRSDYADLERQNAELRAERDAQLAGTQRAWNERDGEKRKRLAAEADNARLRALPLKDEAERVLKQIVETGTRTEVVRVGDMYADDGYDETISEEAELAAALLSRLRAGE